MSFYKMPSPLSCLLPLCLLLGGGNVLSCRVGSLRSGCPHPDLARAVGWGLRGHNLAHCRDLSSLPAVMGHTGFRDNAVSCGYCSWVPNVLRH